MPDTISPSSIDLFQTCNRKYELAKLEGLEPEGPANVATSFGGAWHLIQGYWHCGASPEEAFDLGTVEFQQPTNPKEYRNLDKLRTGFDLYRKHWKGQRFQVLYDNDQLPIVEREFFLGLPHMDVPVHGIMDLMAQYDTNEMMGTEVWAIDYKTQSRLESKWVEQYKASNAFRIYMADALLIEPKTVGVLVDLFHVTPGNKKGPTEEDRAGCHFYRQGYRYEQFMIDEAKMNMRIGLQQIQACEDLGYFPQHAPTGCKMWGGCEFLDICAAQNPEIREVYKNVMRGKNANSS